jgi:hypothetical protein
MNLPTPTDPPALPYLTEAVHYRAHGSLGGEYPPVCRAGIVTEVGAWVTVDTHVHSERSRTVVQKWRPDAIAATVHNPTGAFLHQALERNELPAEFGPGEIVENYRGGTWHSAVTCRATA